MFPTALCGNEVGIFFIPFRDQCLMTGDANDDKFLPLVVDGVQICKCLGLPKIFFLI